MNLKAIKKVELHRHLEGSLRYSTLIEWAKAKKLNLPFNDAAALKKSLVISEPMTDLASVLDKFWTTQSLLDSQKNYERLTYECCEDAYNEGVRLLEIRQSPSFGVTNQPQLTFEKIHRGIVEGMQRARKDFKMGIGLIGVVGRTLTPKEAKYSVDFIIENKKDFVAIDLADKEDGFDCKPFAPLFERARSEGLHITVHAGEINVEKSEYNVKDAAEYLFAERIGHGVQIYKDPKMIEYVKAKGLVLELCPVSNWLTNAIPSHKAHPFRKLMELGVKTTINSDDPGIFGTSLIDDYEVLAEYHSFKENEFKLCNQIAYDASFIPDKSKFW